MTSFPPPDVPWCGPAAHDSGKGNLPVHRIVMHSTVSPCQHGQARNTAAYFRSASAGGSAHYVVDPGEVVQCVRDDTIAWHAPPNEHSLGVEMCDYPDTNKARWNDAPHQATLDRAAHLVAQLCLAYDVPVQFLTVADLKAGKHGITTHNNVSQAWHESDHWDPGAWPKDQFMDDVHDWVQTIKTGDDDMALSDKDLDKIANRVWSHMVGPDGQKHKAGMLLHNGAANQIWQHEIGPQDDQKKAGMTLYKAGKQ